MAEVPRYSRDDVARRGDETYECEILPHLGRDLADFDGGGRHRDGDDRHREGEAPFGMALTAIWMAMAAIWKGPLLDPPPLRGRGRHLPT